MDGLAEGRDLVVVALPGVQRFITEARSTADVSAASEIYAALAARIVAVLGDRAGGELILPSRQRQEAGSGDDGIPNRVVALLPENSGVAAAEQATKAVHDAWKEWVRQVMNPGGKDAPETPGFPRVQWVCVPAGQNDYEAQWIEAQRLLAGRRLVRDFGAVPDEEWKRRKLCTLTPRWPAEPTAPPRTPRHEQKTPLSVAGWVKHHWRRLADTAGATGFPSTASIASAPYRLAVLQRLDDQDVAAAVRDLDEARSGVQEILERQDQETPVKGLMPAAPEHGPGSRLARSGGPWVYPEQWRAETLAREAGLDPSGDGQEQVIRIRDAVSAGQKAARRLQELMTDARLAAYLAVVVQDLDSMGLFLSGQAGDAAGRKIKVGPNEHERVSRELLRVAVAQRAALETPALLSVPVYAGGDDLLFFSPAVTALDAAERCHREIPPELPTASTAVLFFHSHSGIQRAMSEAHDLLEQAKKVPGKHGLAVGYLRRSGAAAVSVQPWAGEDGSSSASRFELFARDHEPRLSPGLVADLMRDEGELFALARESRQLSGAKAGLYRAELARLIRRHADAGGGREAVTRIAAALDWLGRHEHADSPADPGRPGGPELAAQVGVFLRQEAR